MATANLPGPMFRLDFAVSDNCYIEKRQLFLRSYQFCRKRGIADRIKFSLVRVKRLVWQKLRAARKFRRLVWTRLRYSYGRRRFFRLINRYCSSDLPIW